MYEFIGDWWQTRKSLLVREVGLVYSPDYHPCSAWLDTKAQPREGDNQGRRCSLRMDSSVHSRDLYKAKSEELKSRVVVTLRYVSLRYVTLRYVTVPLGEGYVRPLCPPGDAIHARSSPARPGRRGGGSCSRVIGKPFGAFGGSTTCPSLQPCVAPRAVLASSTWITLRDVTLR